MPDPTPESQQPMAPAATPAVPVAPQQAAPQAEMPPQGPEGAPDQDEKFFAALGYFAFLFVVPLIVKPKSAYCKFHARQSMVLFLVAIITLIVLASIPWFGSLLTLALFAVYVLAIYKAYHGDLWSIPLVSKYAGKMNVEALYSKAGLAVSGISGLKEKAQGFASQAAEGVKAIGKQEEAKPAVPQALAPSPQPAVPAPVLPPAAAPTAEPPAPAPQPTSPPSTPPTATPPPAAPTPPKV